jgi:hypothetical protein
MATERTFRINYYREKRKRKKLEKVLNILKDNLAITIECVADDKTITYKINERLISGDEYELVKEYLFDGKKLL